MITDDLEELLAEAYEHLKHGRYRMALTAARRVYEQCPENDKAVMCLAWASLENGDPAHALELANIAVETSNDNVNSRLYRGYLLMRMSVFEGALSDLDKAISQKPDLLSWAYLNKARTLAGMGRFFEALEEIENINETDTEENHKIDKVKEYLRRALGYSEGFLSGILEKKKSLMEEAEEALKEKEYWFSLWAAKNILQASSSIKDYPKARLLELESLLECFRYATRFKRQRKLKMNSKMMNIFRISTKEYLSSFPKNKLLQV